MKIGQILTPEALTKLGTSEEKIKASYQKLSEEQIHETKDTIVRMLRRAHIPGLQLEFWGNSKVLKEVRIPVSHTLSEKYVLTVRDGSVVFSKTNSPGILTVTEFIHKYTFKKNN